MSLINVSSLAYAVYTSIASNAALVSSAYTRVEFGAAINENADRTPWIGVWPGDSELTPWALGGNFWRGPTEVLVYHQVSNRHGQAVSELKEAQGMILSAVSSDVPMKAQALYLERITARLDRFDPAEEGFITNLITFTYNVRGQP